MGPRIYLYKGFVMFDPGDNLSLYNKLRESTFLTLHPRGRQFYCMMNNSAILFIKAYASFLSSHFDIAQEVIDFVEQEEIDYVPKWDKQLKVPTFDGITWKEHQKNALNLISRFKRYCIFLGPGTGKTLIALGAIKMIEDSNPTKHTYLVVTPKKAIPQYSTEIKKYLPSTLFNR